MAGRMIHPREASTASSRGSRTGPTPATQELAEYTRLISPVLPFFSGELDTLIFDDWEMMLGSCFDAHEVPDRCRVPIAALQLRGPALFHWEIRRMQLGSRVPWFVFSEAMRDRFRRDGRITRWRYRMARFNQRHGETIQTYGRRFQDDIVQTFPTGTMGPLAQMIVYSQGVQPYFRIPQLAGPFNGIADMRAAYEAYDDRALLPFGYVPPAPVPAPEPVPAPAPEPAPMPEFVPAEVHVPAPADAPVPDVQAVPEFPVFVPEPEDQVVPDLHMPAVPDVPVIVLSDDDTETDMELDSAMDSDYRLPPDHPDFDPYLDA